MTHNKTITRNKRTKGVIEEAKNIQPNQQGLGILSYFSSITLSPAMEHCWSLQSFVFLPAWTLILTTLILVVLVPRLLSSYGMIPVTLHLLLVTEKCWWLKSIVSLPTGMIILEPLPLLVVFFTHFWSSANMVPANHCLLKVTEFSWYLHYHAIWSTELGVRVTNAKSSSCSCWIGKMGKAVVHWYQEVWWPRPNSSSGGFVHWEKKLKAHDRCCCHKR